MTSVIRQTLKTLGALGPLLLLALLLAGCEGEGTGGDGLVIRTQPTPACGAVGSPFPSGMSLLSPGAGFATVVQFEPPGLAVYRYDLEQDRPVRTAFSNIGTDSDGDGVDDQLASEPLFPCRIFCQTQSGGVIPVVGALNAINDTLAFLSTSGYEQVLSVDPRTATAIDLLV